MAQAVCPTCSRKVAGGITRCPDCGTKLAGWKPAPAEAERAQEPEPARAPLPRPKKRKKKKAEKPGLTEKQKIGLFVGGGLLASFLLIGGVVFFVLRRGDPVDSGPSGGGQYAVVDSLPSPPAEPAEEPAPPLDVDEGPAPTKAATPRAVWAVKPDPPSGDDKPPANVVGALSPEPALLLASLRGPYAVGVPEDPERARRAKLLKGADATAGLVSIDKDPHPVLDIRTGKPAGQFPAEARITFSCRLSPDGRYLVSRAYEKQAQTFKVTRNELVVWQRDADKPACTWPLPGGVLWADFIAPDRLALYHTTPKPQFVILDVTKGTPVVTAPLPDEDFSHQHDHLGPRDDKFSFYRVQPASGAVSPGRRLVALGGRTNVVLVETADGKVAGRLPIGPVEWAENYLGMSFSEDGSQLRALANETDGMYRRTLLRVWSLADGETLHKTPFQYNPRHLEDPRHNPVPALAILSGPEPNTLLVGHQVFDLTSGQVVAEVPTIPQRWLGPKRLLALGTLEQAQNARELGEAVDFVPRGKSLIVTALDRVPLVSKAAKLPPGVPGPPGGAEARPAPARADRSKVTAVRLKPPAQWAVKPGAEVPRPTGPLPSWPHAFAATEAAVLTERLSWIRYDLNTGEAIGEPIGLWTAPDRFSRPNARIAYTAALRRDGKQFALVDLADKARVDVWDTAGKRLIGLRPYQDDPILWLGWSADGQLLTATRERLSGWDAGTGQAAFEVDGNFEAFTASSGAEWLLVTTPARHLFFVEAATGRCLGHIPASPTYPEHALSPDGKTLLRLGRQGKLQVWDLQTGKRKDDPQAPVVPLTLAIADAPQRGVRPQPVTRDTALKEPYLGVYWVGPRWLLSNTKNVVEEHPHYYLYDLDVHTHTHSYAFAQVGFRTDSLGRVWMSLGAQERWKAPEIPGAAPFQQTVAFGPGSTIRVEVNVGSRKVNPRMAENLANTLHARGFKIGRDGWVLRVDHTIGTASTDLTDLSTGQKGVSVMSLETTWRLLDPEGKEVWQGKGGSKFDPFNSKYVVVGSRKTEGIPGPFGGGSRSIRLDYQGMDARTAQLEEILERMMGGGQALPYKMPICLVKKEGGGYTALPLEASLDGKKP